MDHATRSRLLPRPTISNTDQTSDPSTQTSSIPLYMFKVTISES